MELKADKPLRDEINTVTKAATKLTSEWPQTVMDKKTTPPSGDKHDYLTLAPYFWPDSTKECGLPWINKDWQLNPMTRGGNVDFDAMKYTFSAVNNLSKAAFYTLDQKYAKKALQFLRAWFIEPATKRTLILITLREFVDQITVDVLL